MFDELVDTAAENYSRDTDKGSLTIYHSSLQSPVFVHLQNLDNIDGEKVMERFERVLNSHEEMTVDQSFVVNIGLLRKKKGGGKKGLPLAPYLDNTRFSMIKRKRSIIEIICSEGETICGAKPLLLYNVK